MQDLVGVGQGLNCRLCDRVGGLEVGVVRCGFVQLDEAAEDNALVVRPAGRNTVSVEKYTVE